MKKLKTLEGGLELRGVFPGDKVMLIGMKPDGTPSKRNHRIVFDKGGFALVTADSTNRSIGLLCYTPVEGKLADEISKIRLGAENDHIARIGITALNHAAVDSGLKPLYKAIPVDNVKHLVTNTSLERAFEMRCQDGPGVVLVPASHVPNIMAHGQRELQRMRSKSGRAKQAVAA